MFTKNNRNDGDDNVNIDFVQGRNEVESEQKDLINISKKDALASDRTKNIIELGHSEENKTDELEIEMFFKARNLKKKEILMIQLILILVLICQKLSIDIIVKNVKKKKKNL